jgi:hypothetical protein
MAGSPGGPATEWPLDQETSPAPGQAEAALENEQEKACFAAVARGRVAPSEE